jgi:hypothetical protein
LIGSDAMGSTQPTNITFQDLIRNFDLTAKTQEAPEERRSRLARENADAKAARVQAAKDADHSRRKDLLAFQAFLGALGLVMVVAVIAFFMPGTSTEAKDWSRATLTAIVVGGMSYFNGKAAGRAER